MKINKQKEKIIDKIIDKVRGTTYQRDSGLVQIVESGLWRFSLRQVQNLYFLIDINLKDKR